MMGVQIKRPAVARKCFAAAVAFCLAALVGLVSAGQAFAKDLQADWPYFRADINNNGVVDVPLPTSPDDAVLYWGNKFGTGNMFGGDIVGPPILVDGHIYTYAGTKLLKVDVVTGEVVAEGSMVGKSSFSMQPPVYGEGKIFVGLFGGVIEAFDAETLEPLWVYENSKGGQPNCPLTYRNGQVYTGYWVDYTTTADYVCVSADATADTTPATDPTQPAQKSAQWTCSNAGGYYWAGSYAGDGFVLFGSDAYNLKGVDTQKNASGTLYMVDTNTGAVLDSLTSQDYPGGVHVGNIRSTVMYDEVTDAYYYGTSGGYLCSFKLAADKRSIDSTSIKTLCLDNGQSACTSNTTPVIYNGRAYVAAETGAYGDYKGQMINVVDLNANAVVYKVQMSGRPQASGLLTRAYESQDGAVYLYFVDNFTPGKLRYFVDRPGQSQQDPVVWEMGVDGKTYGAAGVLFAPQGDMGQFCICSPICDSNGFIYLKNDSGHMMAIGPKIESLEVVKGPGRTAYVPGEQFDPEGMQVMAHYTNGTSRDISEYVTYSDSSFTEAQIGSTVEIPLEFTHTRYQATMTNQPGGGDPYTAPSTSVNVTVFDGINLSDATVAVEDQTYTGEPLTPPVTVTHGDTVLVEGTDYAVSYKNNVEVGTATVVITGINNYGGKVSATFEIKHAPTLWHRLGGENRYETMALITDEGFTDGSCANIIVANGVGYADALYASALAGAINAPIITTPTDVLDESASAQITRVSNGNAHVYVVGGPNVVSDAVINQISKINGIADVVRVAGEDRTLTSVTVCKQGVGQWGNTAIVSDGWNFADALSISSYAAVNKAPIFGARDGQLTDEQVTAIKMGGFTQILVVGGDNSVDYAAVQATLGSDMTYLRLQGPTRYETSHEIVKWSTGSETAAAFQPQTPLVLNNMVVATGESSADALVSVNLAGPKGSALLLAKQTDASHAIIDEIIGGGKTTMLDGYVVGGPLSVPDEVMTWCINASR